MHAVASSSAERIGDETLHDESATELDTFSEVQLAGQAQGTELVRYPHAITKKANELVLYIECDKGCTRLFSIKYIEVKLIPPPSPCLTAPDVHAVVDGVSTRR